LEAFGSSQEQARFFMSQHDAAAFCVFS